jgi:hypothetical protein
MGSDEKNNYLDSVDRAIERPNETPEGYVPWGMGALGKVKGDVIWRCDILRAGKLYGQSYFENPEEAERFAAQVRAGGSDEFSAVEGVQTSSIWN